LGVDAGGVAERVILASTSDLCGCTVLGTIVGSADIQREDGEMTTSTTTRTRNRTIRAVLTGALAVGILGASVTADAATGPVQAGLTLTPSSAAVSQVVTGTATATNTSNAAISQVAMGIDIPSGLAYTGLVRPVNGSCRATFVTNHRLVYCNVSNLAPGQTATLKVTVSAPATGSYAFRVYARQLYTTTDTFAYATLTVH
jgi:hypothetical protein